MSYPYTGIGSCWTSVQFCPVKREIGGNHPLQDVFSEHLGSRAASSPVGQCQLWERTVVKQRKRVVLDNANYEFGQLSSGCGLGREGWFGRGRDGRVGVRGGTGQPAAMVAAAVLTRARRSSRLAWRHCSHLKAGDPAQLPGGGREVQGHGGRDGLADAGGDVVRLQDTVQAHVITCQF